LPLPISLQEWVGAWRRHAPTGNNSTKYWFMESHTPMAASRSPSSILRDTRVLSLIGQIIFAIVIIAALYGLLTSILSALEAQNLLPNLRFLQDRAGFDIGEAPAWYSSDRTYWDAYTIGFINTLRVVIAGLVLSTVIGIFLGIFLLSRNWLLRNSSRSIVEVLRNTPILVQLFVWYFVVMLSLPTFQQSISLPPEGYASLPLRWIVYLIGAYLVWNYTRNLPPQRSHLRRPIVWAAVASAILAEIAARFGLVTNAAFRFEIQPWIYLNIRGLAFPELLPTARFADWLAFVTIGVVLAFVQWVYLGRVKEATGHAYPRLLYAVAAIGLLTVVGWVIVSGEPAATTVTVTNADGQATIMPIEQARADELITPEEEAVYAAAPLLLKLPQKNNFRFTQGLQILPEYAALFLALTIYTAVFIAEIVRAGILAVPPGQVEAARALGLSGSDVLRLVILPQALRVIIPPLGNQYLNLAKNSSLAIAVAYADLFQITTTIMNQSGQSVTGMIMVMITYLLISLTIAALSERANRRFQIVTR